MLPDGATQLMVSSSPTRAAEMAEGYIDVWVIREMVESPVEVGSGRVMVMVTLSSPWVNTNSFSP